MRVISKKTLVDFYKKHPNAKIPLLAWYNIVRKNNFSSFNELRKLFPSVDKVKQLYVFNIGGNNFRLIAAIHFNTKILFVRNVLSHKEYDKGAWKK